MKKPELMCPIKDWSSLEACKNYADAVYFGVNDLSLRARAGIKIKELPIFVKKCHDLKIKTYLTLNSVVYNKDIKKAEEIIKKAKKAKIDALIVWDFAIIDLVKKYKIPFIVSTQMNVSNYKSAMFFKKLGAKRIVLAREMNLKDIAELKKKAKIEVEVFIHGAMCLAISGRCILSSYLYGKSSNCGACAQPCRKEWILSDNEGNSLINEGKYFLSAKDLCMIEHVPQLIKTGIDSFKIEGRRRDAKYIEVTARCYREAIDAYFNKTYTKEKIEKWKQELNTVYNRGFSTGFYFSIPSKEGIGYDKADNLSLVKKIYIGDIVKYYPKINVAALKLSHRGIKLGEKIMIEGEKTFIEDNIESIHFKEEKVEKGLKGQEVGIKVKSKVNKGDKVFMFDQSI
ncbi:MAG: U32 family peptidase [Candidatus Pacebacteria bacterium]|nr:U32 family peptidase [Candidatus Paceibacterota bacterium]